jgi:hypothetical protein
MNYSRFPILALTLICATSAQSMPPSGSFGFLLNNQLDPTSQDSGTAILGVLNFDGAGNVTGPVVFVRGSGVKPVQDAAVDLVGTYSSNPDGTGSMTGTLAGALPFTIAMVIGDSGQSIQLVTTGPADVIGGGVLGGSAKAAYAGPLKGSYAFQLNNFPIPAGTIGVISFDGAGNATVSFTTVGVGNNPDQPDVVSTGSLTGTYAVNPDGSGTITLPNSAYAFVITDGGSGLLLLQTDGTGHSTSNGVARLQ